MRGAFQLTTGPTVEPVDLQDLKDGHLRIDVGDDDGYTAGLITVARQWLEQQYEQVFITQTWKYVLDSFPGLQPQTGWIRSAQWGRTWLEIPMAPLQSVVSATYLDPQGNLQTLDPAVYVPDTISAPPRIGLAAGKSWPATNLGVINSVTWNLKFGYGDAPANVPANAKHAIALIVAHFYENREENVIAERIRPLELPLGVARLMRPLDWRSLVA